MYVILATQRTIKPTFSTCCVDSVLEQVELFVQFRVASKFVLAFMCKKIAAEVLLLVLSLQSGAEIKRSDSLISSLFVVSESMLSCLDLFCGGVAAKKSVIFISAMAGWRYMWYACKKGARHPCTPICRKHWVDGNKPLLNT